MSRSAKQATSRDRVQTYRARLRRQGLRPIQLWVPDTRSPEFAAAAHRQSAAVAASPYEREDQAFIDAISAEPDR
jgi:DNA-binding LacI/PurR family transcriptional regulator